MDVELPLGSAGQPQVPGQQPFVPTGQGETTCSTWLHQAASEGDHAAIRHLLGSQPSPAVDEPNSYGWTALHFAAHRGSTECVRLLLDAGASPDTCNYRYETALHKAAGNPRATEIVKMLLSAGASYDAADVYGTTPLHGAADGGHAAAVQLLIDAGANVDALDDGHHTPLYKVANRSGCLECARLLLAHGASAGASNRKGSTPLHMAAHMRYITLATLLVEHGASITAIDQLRDTPLHSAVYNGGIEVTAMLLQKGANARAANREGQTALHIAAEHGHANCVAILAAHGADMDARDMSGRTALHAVAKWRPRTAVEFAVAVITAGGSPDVADRSNMTPLHTAAFYKHAELVEALIRGGADVNAVDDHGRTPLVQAANKGSPQVAALLLEAGAAVEGASSQAWTPLHGAAFEGHTGFVATLLAAGASTAAVELQSGRTPLHCAAQKGSSECTALLLVCGADHRAVDKDGKTAVQWAVERGHSEVALLLQDAEVRPVELAVLQPAIVNLEAGRAVAQAAGQKLRDGARQRAEIESSVKLMVRLNLAGEELNALSAYSGGSGTTAPGRRGRPAAAPPVDLAPWKLEFDQLKLERGLGQGSYGQVWLATLNRLPVAVKVFNFLGATAVELVEEMTKEAAMMAAVPHDNIVGFRGVVYFPPCIVSEYCHRGSLLEVLRAARDDPAFGSQLSWPLRLSMALDAAMGMLHLHSHQPVIIHRDLKAVNLLVDSNFRVKVADFNLSKLILDTSMSARSAAGPQNPRWLAPEVLLGSTATTASDVFSFGVVLWELLTWELPWEGTEPFPVSQLVAAGQRLPLPPVLPVDRLPGPGLQQFVNSGGLELYTELIRACWHQNAEERLHFNEIETVLRMILQQLVGMPHHMQHVEPGAQQASSMPALEPDPHNKLAGSPAAGASNASQQAASMPALEPAPHGRPLSGQAGGKSSALQELEPQAGASQAADLAAAQLAGHKRALPPSLLTASQLNQERKDHRAQ